MKTFFLIFVITVSIHCLFGQNRDKVLFEENFDSFLSCPTNLGQWELLSRWYIPVSGSPDYFHPCLFDELDSTNGFYQGSKRIPNLTSGCVGLVLFSTRSRGLIEYLSIRLPRELDAGEKLEVFFKIGKIDDEPVDLKKFSIYFSNEKFPRTRSIRKYDCITGNKKNIIDFDLSNIAQGEWQIVNESYVSKGGESFIHLGLFTATYTNRDYKVLERKMNKELGTLAGVFIDSVSIIKTED